MVTVLALFTLMLVAMLEYGLLSKQIMDTLQLHIHLWLSRLMDQGVGEQLQQILVG